jgi:hypothetical protein
MPLIIEASQAWIEHIAIAITIGERLQRACEPACRMAAHLLDIHVALRRLAELTAMELTADVIVDKA